MGQVADITGWGALVCLVNYGSKYHRVCVQNLNLVNNTTPEHRDLLHFFPPSFFFANLCCIQKLDWHYPPKVPSSAGPAGRDGELLKEQPKIDKSILDSLCTRKFDGFTKKASP